MEKIINYNNALITNNNNNNNLKNSKKYVRLKKYPTFIDSMTLVYFSSVLISFFFH